MKGRALAWLRWAAAALLLALAARLVFANPEPLRKLLEVRLEVVLAIAGLIICNQVLIACRLALAVSQCGGHGVPGWTWFRLTSIGQFLNLFVPQLGNLFRAVALKRDHGIPYTLYAAGLFAFVWLDLVIGLLLSIAAIAVLEPGFAVAGVSAVVALSGLLLLVLAAPFLAGRLVPLLPLQNGWAGRVQQRSAGLLAVSLKAVQSARFLGQAFVLNLLMVTGQVTTLWLAFNAVGAPIAFSRLILFQMLVKTSNQVVITPGNLGLTELIYGVFAGALNGGVQQGIAVALLLRTLGTVIVIAVGLLLGGASLLRGGRGALAVKDQPGAEGASAIKK